MTEFFGHKILLITQDKISQSCTLFSKARVCHSVWRCQIHRLLACSPPSSGLVSITADKSYRDYEWVSGACIPTEY